MSITSLVNKFRKKKKVVLSNEEKVKALSEKSVGLFDHMKKAHTELGVINEELKHIVHDEEKRIENEIERHQRELKRMSDNKVKAMDEIKINGLIQNELTRFIR